jgi:hypothetical protein
MTATGQSAEQYRLFFTGDILLAREVAHEIDARHGASPWMDLDDELKQADFVLGNLEGSVGDPKYCLAKPELCFADNPRFLPLLKKAGFTAVGIANNHSGDLGAEGRCETRAALEALGIAPIGSPESPAFLRLGDRTVAIVTLSLVPSRDSVVDAVPSWEMAQKLRLARALSDWVIVFVHWGKELADWVIPQQVSEAKWLIAQGADVVIGAHPHVVEPPTCVDGRPVFYSLGNHVFDQKYAITKHGLIADCRISGARLTCGGITTETPIGSAFPRISGTLGNDALAACSVTAGKPLTAGGQTIRAWANEKRISYGGVALEGKSPMTRWRTVSRALLGAQIGNLMPDKPPMLFTLERHPSSIDAEDGSRPYVYDLTPHGLIARWRGSALAWPILDATLISDSGGRAYLCALHRGDSFIMLDPSHHTQPRLQVYRWNGFGFSGITDSDLTVRCRSEFGQDLPN